MYECALLLSCGILALVLSCVKKREKKEATDSSKSRKLINSNCHTSPNINNSQKKTFIQKRSLNAAIAFCVRMIN